MLKYALIGCGRISINHIRAALNNQLEIVAVCDIVTEHMVQALEKSGARQNKNIKFYTDYKEMINENNIDLISIATESGKHAEIALYCIKNKINVIIEKPVAMSIQDADEIIYQAEKNNVKVCACHQNRFNIAVQNTRKALEDGRFGKISHGTVHVRWNRNNGYYKQALWRGTWEQDGGALMNQCIHGIDLLRWMLGDEIEEVYGTTRKQFHNYIEAEDFGTAIVTFKNGSVGIIEGTTNIYPENLEESLYLFGEKGTVKIGGKSVNNIDIWNFSDENKEDSVIKGLHEMTNNVYGNGHSRLFADMVSAIEDDRKPYIDGCAGKRALELVLAVYKSQKDKVPVKLPIVNFGTKDMIGIFQ
jgi:predicted dehydrogenase